MRYDENTPQASDIPRDNQDEFVLNFETLNDFYGIDHIPFSRSVENATQANPCVITSTDHGLDGTEMVTIENLKGLDAEGDTVYWSINENSYAISVLTDDTFELTGANTTNEQEYIESSGNYQIDTSNYYGTHKKITFSENRGTVSASNPPNLATPKSSLYLLLSDMSPFKYVQDEQEESSPNLFFQNGVSTNEQLQLTSASSTQTLLNGRGFKTPFGFTINFGGVSVNPASAGSTITFPIPYQTTNFATLVFISELALPISDLTTNVYVDSTNLVQAVFKARNVPSGRTLPFLSYYISFGV